MRRTVLLCDVCEMPIRDDDRSKLNPVPYIMKSGEFITVSVVIDSKSSVDICWSCIKRMMGWESMGKLK